VTTPPMMHGPGAGALQAQLSDSEMESLQQFATAHGLSLDDAATELASRALANRHLGRRLAPAAVLQFGAMRKPGLPVPVSAA